MLVTAGSRSSGWRGGHRARFNAGVDFDCQTEEPARLVKEAFFQLAPPADVQQTQIWLLCLPMFLPLLK